VYSLNVEDATGTEDYGEDEEEDDDEFSQ
jgi:hypothetical protein